MGDNSFRWNERRPTERAEEYGEAVTAGSAMSRLRRGLGVRPRRKQRNGNTSTGKLGMIDGVYFRVLTNLFGVIMFLRLGWMVGYAGIVGSIMVICLCSSLTFITALSLSAICTNGKVAAGGAYYLISRALGPEFGASIGILFYIATTVSVSLYLLGFAETVVNVVDGPVFTENWDMPLIAIFGLIFCQLICLVGVTWVVKIEKAMLFVLIVTIALFAIGVFMGPSDSNPWFGEVPVTSGINVWPDFTAKTEPMFPTSDYVAFMYEKKIVKDPGFNSLSQCSKSSRSILEEEYFQVNVGVVLAVFFPAVTGILAGANISGDLKDPSSSIPVGTLSAILSGAGVYSFLALLFGTGFYRTTIVSATAMFNISDTLIFDCTYGGLFHDSALVAKSSVSAPFVYFGIYAASISSGLAGMLGAPRILQALARDRLFSFLDPFANGYGRGDEPIAAYAVTFLLASLFILAGDINTIAPLITTFFLSSYAMVNYACYSAEESKSPGWRPTFKYFSKWLAFLGAMGCVSVMLFLSAIFGFITFTIGLALYKYVEVYTREGGYVSNWGPHKEASQYHTALSAALLLEEQATPMARPRRASSSASSVDGNGLQRHTPVRSNSMESEDPNSRASTHVEIELSDASAPVQPLSTSLGNRSDIDDEEEDESGDGRAFEREQFSGHEPLFDTTHIKNYRPQCLVLSGPPRRRPALAVLMAGLRKARGVTVFGDVLVGELSDPEILRTRNARASVSYVAKYGIKAFSDVMIAPSFRTGCRSLMQLSGLGRRMRVNVVVLGFLDDWKVPLTQRSRRDSFHIDPSSDPNRDTPSHTNHSSDDYYSPPPSVVDYVGVIGDAFDLGLGVVILRGELDLLRSEYLTQTIRTEMERVMSLGLSKQRDRFTSQNGSYRNPNYMAEEHAPQQIHTMIQGNERPREIAGEDRNSTSGDPRAARSGSVTVDSNSIPEAHSESGDIVDRKSERRIDVWWLVDDGGLTIMLPHILRQAKTPPWIGCTLRVMAIGATRAEAQREEEDMMKLLDKLRIPAKVSVVSLESLGTSRSNESSTAEISAARTDGLENIALQDDLDHDTVSGSRGSPKNALQRQLFKAYSTMDDSQNSARRETYSKIGELIALNSPDALLVVVSLPVPPMSMNPEEYMCWLDLLSKRSIPPVLMVRGSQRDVVTMFS